MPRVLVSGLLALALLPAARGQDKEPDPDPKELQARAILTVDPGGHVGPVTGLAFTPDGKRLVTAGQDKTIQIWDVATGERLKVLRPPLTAYVGGVITGIALAPDGKTLAVGSYGVAEKQEVPASWDRYTYLINLETGPIVWLAGPKYLIAGVSFSADGDRLAACAQDRARGSLGKVWVWKDLKGVWDRAPADGKIAPWKLYSADKFHAEMLALSPDGTRVVAGENAAKRALLWDLADPAGAPPRREMTFNEFPTRLAWGPDGKTLVTLHSVFAKAEAALVRLWSADGKEQVAVSKADLAPLGDLYRNANRINGNFVAFRP